MSEDRQKVMKEPRCLRTLIVGEERAIKIFIKYLDILKSDKFKAERYLADYIDFLDKRSTKMFYYYLLKNFNLFVGCILSGREESHILEAIESMKIILS